MRLSPWGRVVAISALLIVGGLIVLVSAGLASRERRLVSFPVTGALQGLTFDLGDGDITIVGGGRRDALEIRRTERYAFGRSPESISTPLCARTIPLPGPLQPLTRDRRSPRLVQGGPFTRC